MARYRYFISIFLIFFLGAGCGGDADDGPGNTPGDGTGEPGTPGNPGAPALLAATPETLSFEPVPAPGEASRSIEITNVSGEQVDIELTASGDAFALLPPTKATLAAGASEVFEVRFSPRAPEAAAGSIMVSRTDSGDALLQVPLSGMGMAMAGAPDLHVLQPVVDFGTVVVGDVATRSMLIENQGDGAALIEEASFEASALRVITPLPLVIPPGATRSISVRFAPPSTGGSPSTYRWRPIRSTRWPSRRRISTAIRGRPATAIRVAHCSWWPATRPRPRHASWPPRTGARSAAP